MRVRALLWLTAIVSSIVGGVAVYLALSVPNDLRADEMLKKARAELSAGRVDPARRALERIIQQYPRTDAAAAATVALVKLSEQENEKLHLEVNRLRQDLERQTRQVSEQLSGLGKRVESIKNAPSKTVTVQAPVKKTTPKRSTAKKRTPTRTRRRR
jgi:TolA-binding protein